MHVIAIPPGGRARAHLHEAHEAAVYMVEGEVICWYGDQLQHRFTARAGEMAYIPAGVPHLPINASVDEPVTCIVARTDPTSRRASWSCPSSRRSRTSVRWPTSSSSSACGADGAGQPTATWQRDDSAGARLASPLNRAWTVHWPAAGNVRSWT